MAEFENRLACVIRADGGIARGYLIDTCKAKTNFAGTIGGALDEKVEPGFITVGLTSDPKQMRVQTYDAAGRPAARSFHIAAFRDQ
jgi:hypothetical protein